MSMPIADTSMSSGSRYVAPVAIVVATALAVWGITGRLHARSVLQQEAAAAMVPTVIVVRATPSAVGEQLVLPGTTRAFKAASIHARTSGFLKAWYTDIGTPVKKGQLLAEIDAPELDQELKQAQAEHAAAQANYHLALTTAARWQGLLTNASVSKQDAEEKAAEAAAKKAAVDSAAANVARLRKLASFKRIIAPFDGTVVVRNTDIGSLINAGQSDGGELFRVVDMHRLRVYVDVPQTYIASVTPGLDASITFPGHPSRRYAAKIARSAKAIDPETHTLQIELDVDNANGELLTGAYVEVKFELSTKDQNLRLPPTAVLFRAAGVQVATIGANNRVVFKEIVQGRDFGDAIEVLAGIDANDNVVLNPPDWLVDGAQVHVSEAVPHPPLAAVRPLAEIAR